MTTASFEMSSCCSSSRIASKPPAEAPMPTMKSLDERSPPSTGVPFDSALTCSPWPAYLARSCVRQARAPRSYGCGSISPGCTLPFGAPRFLSDFESVDAKAPHVPRGAAARASDHAAVRAARAMRQGRRSSLMKDEGHHRRDLERTARAATPPEKISSDFGGDGGTGSWRTGCPRAAAHRDRRRCEARAGSRQRTGEEGRDKSPRWAPDGYPPAFLSDGRTQ